MQVQFLIVVFLFVAVVVALAPYHCKEMFSAIFQNKFLNSRLLQLGRQCKFKRVIEWTK